jgi:hypothetical protein
MAKQIGPHTLKGTIGDVTYYEDDEGRPLARKKSSLSRRRVKYDPRFIRTMQHARNFGKGTKLAQSLYLSLPKQSRDRSMFRKMTGIAARAIYKEMPAETIATLLADCIAVETKRIQTAAAAAKRKAAKAASDSRSTYLATPPSGSRLCNYPPIPAVVLSALPALMVSRPSALKPLILFRLPAGDQPQRHMSSTGGVRFSSSFW